MDRTAALELAASLPKGDPVRRELLARLKGARLPSNFKTLIPEMLEVADERRDMKRFLSRNGVSPKVIKVVLDRVWKGWPARDIIRNVEELVSGGRLASSKEATSVSLPRIPSGGPDQDWYDRAIEAVERDRTIEARGLENKVLMMAWDLGYELASGGDNRYYQGEYEKLRYLALHLGLLPKVEKEWKDGRSSFGKMASSKTSGRNLARYSKPNSYLYRFFDETDISRRRLNAGSNRNEFDYEGKDFGVKVRGSYRGSEVTLFFPLENIGRRGKKVSMVHASFYNEDTNVAWDATFKDQVSRASSARTALKLLHDMVKEAESRGDSTAMWDRELKGVDKSLPTPTSQKIEDIKGRTIVVDMNAKPLRVYDANLADELEKSFQRYRFEIPHRYKKKVHSLRDDIAAAKSYKEVQKILDANRIRYDFNIHMDPMYQ